jgi:hypothetical protein
MTDIYDNAVKILEKKKETKKLDWFLVWVDRYDWIKDFP